MITTLESGRSKALGVPTVVMLGMLLVAGTFTAPAASASTVAAKAATDDRRIADGVTLTTWRVRVAKSGPTVVVRAVTIDPYKANGRLVVARKGRLARTSALTKSVGGLVGINGSFFAGGRPRGLTLAGGKVHSRPSGYAAERTLFVDSHGLRIGSPTSTRGTTAITGRFQLVSDGEVSVRDGNRRLFQRHPRTFAGTTSGGRIVLATIAGGATLRETARIAQRLGMREAINLDGGGSSSMVVKGRVINRSGGERAVADALVWKVSRKATGAARGGASWGW